jgi:general secretion pathway protein D
MRLSLTKKSQTPSARALAVALLLLIWLAAAPQASAQSREPAKPPEPSEPSEPSGEPSEPSGEPSEPRGEPSEPRGPGRTGRPDRGRGTPRPATSPRPGAPIPPKTSPTSGPRGVDDDREEQQGGTRPSPSAPRSPSSTPTRAGRPGTTPGRSASGAAGSAARGADTNTPQGETLSDDSLYACDKAKGRFKVNLAPDVELKDLVTWAFSFTCKNFIYNSAIASRAAKVTIKSPESMSAKQAWSVFLVALQSMGLTVVPKGNVLEIVEYAQAKTAPLPVHTKGRPANLDQMVRAVLRPEHLPVDEVAAILNEVKSKDGAVKGIPKAGVVVVTDFGTHIGRMGQLMLAVDTPVLGEKLYLLRVKNADATEMATKLQEILGTRDAAAPGSGGPSPAPPPPPPRRPTRGANQPQPPTAQTTTTSTGAGEVESAVPSKVLADERTNALIVLASEPAYLRVKALVNRLDVSIDVEGEGRIHVYPLEHADAEETAATLTAVISGIAQPPSGGGGNQRPGGGGRGDRQQPGQQGRQPRDPEGPQPRAVPRPTANADSAAAFEGDVRVTHDKPTNSLVVVASVKDFLALREVLKKLDVPRPQVYIEASIVEVSIDNSRDLGAAWHAGKEVGDGDLVIGGVQHSNLSSLNVASIANATGLIGGALGHLLPGAEELLGTSIPSYGILFQALATTNNLDVLSSPHILTTDNEEAEISVGQNIPYQSALVGLPGIGVPGGQDGGGATSSFFPTQSIQRQDVELNLKLTPQINASGEVKLVIDLTINDIASQDFAGLGPSWSKKTLKDTVVVRDQQAVVLGGLISDKVTNTESKVPLLGDIPLLGYLFKFSGKQKEKRNLLIVLTPTIVHNHTDLERILERRVREQREFMRTFSTFREIEYRPEVDYGRKRGLLSEINRAVKEQERQARILEEMEQREITFPEGPVEYSEDPPTGQEPPSGPEGDGDGTEQRPESDKPDGTSAESGASAPGEKTGDEATGSDTKAGKKSDAAEPAEGEEDAAADDEKSEAAQAKATPAAKPVAAARKKPAAKKPKKKAKKAKPKGEGAAGATTAQDKAKPEGDGAGGATAAPDKAAAKVN